MIMRGWPELLSVDFLAPSEPSFVALAQGTTSNNFDFGPATGGITSPTPPTASYKVNTGTLTLGSVTWTGSAWRVPVSGMTNGISGTIKLSFRGADGQVTSQVVGFLVAKADYLAPAPPADQVLAIGTTTATIDFGYATGVSTSGTPTAVIGPSGAIVSVVDTGSVWRVSVNGLANATSYEVLLSYVATDGQVTQQAAMLHVPKADYLAPGTPAAQELSIGTTSVTIDFGYATGVSTTGIPTAAIEPSGSIVSVTDTGSAWRVSVNGLADGKSYAVKLSFDATDDQVTQQTARLAVGASVVTAWKDVYTYDFTDCTAKDVSAEGTHNVFKADGTTPLVDVVRSHTGTTAATFSGVFTPGTGLVISQSSPAIDSRNATCAFDLALASLDFAHNLYYVEVLVNTAELEAGANATLNISYQAQTGGSGEPAFGMRFDRSIATNWRRSSRKRFSGTTTNEATTTGSGTEIPTTMNIGLWLAAGNLLRIYQGSSATYQGPLSLPSDYVATAYADTQAGSATDANAWSAGNWMVYSATNQTIGGGNTTLTIKGLRIWAKQPEL